MEKETNLEKAKRLYPKGTVFKAIGEDTNNVYTSDGVFNVLDIKTAWVDSVLVNGYVFVYNSYLNKWAEIVQQDEKDEPIKEKKKYDLVIKPTTDELIQTVNEFMKVGYYPKGGIKIYQRQFIQTIYLIEE